LFTKIEISTCKTLVENGRGYMYKYYLTESSKNIIIGDMEISVPSYGLGIIGEQILEGKIVDTYEELFDAVSPKRNKVISLSDFLVDNEVSPLHLIDVIGESVDNWVTDYEIEAISKLSIGAMA
jgi:hypothetical protein